MSVCHAASIVLDGDNVVYFGPQDAFWSVPVAAIQAIGELTAGGSAEGHFLAIVTDTQGGWFQAPCSAAGLDQLLAQLGTRLNASLELRLSNSTKLRSRVLWPAQLAGQHMFEFRADGTARLLITNASGS